ncbi:GGDEF domain-containing protein, partial [Vibrio parahaemolyticus]|nr:GGDEF domain-containing protein [Vibrio parahaemolyticus]
FELEDYSNEKDNPFYIDQLTGVYNRNYLNVAIHKMNKSKYSAISIIFADIDGLKFVNDGFGHDYGDKLIMEVSSILKDSTRKSDIIVRYGGDEFIIFLPNTDVSELNHVTKRINDSINYFNNTNQLNPMRISLSIGSCTIYSDEITIDDGIKKAEDLMYTEKLKQRTNVQKTYIDAIREVLQYKEPTTNDLSEFLDELTI